MRLPITPLKWLLTLGLLGGLLFGLFLIHAAMREEEEGETPPPAKSSNGIVQLEEDEAERFGLETEAAQARQWYEQTAIYGRIVANPRVTMEMRSPFAGTLRAVGGTGVSPVAGGTGVSPVDAAWPIPGQWLRAGQTLGWVDIRVGPDVRLDLQNKLVDARSKQRGAEKEVEIQQGRVNRLEAVTSPGIIARTELDAALVQLTQARTRLATAKAAAELWQQAIEEVERHKGDEDSLWSQRLTAPADGEVTDLMGRPGMAVEPGAVVVQLVDFRHPLIRLDFPPEILAPGGPPPDVEVHLPSFPQPGLSGVRGASRSAAGSPSLQAHLVGPAPRVDGTSQFVSYLYEGHVAAATTAKANTVSGGVWRPGMQVTAHVRAEGAPAQPAAAVPVGSVLYHEGRPLLYVRVKAETYERREVRLLGRDGDYWIVGVRKDDLPVGVTPQESVVSRQAQVLLSKEFLVAAAEDDD